MGEGAPRRGSGGRHPRPRPGARTVRSPRWTLGTNSSSQVGGPLARQYRTAQNIWNTWLRISGTHKSRKDVGSWRAQRSVRTRIGKRRAAAGFIDGADGDDALIRRRVLGWIALVVLI